MKTTAIIVEYNPFHNGHEYMIKKTRELTGSDYIIVLMSGDFVQRGAPAICSKYLRAEMALYGGADIVFELPCLYSLGSAEIFASGAVNLLNAIGNIDYLAFGSESGNIDELINCAELLETNSHTEDFRRLLSLKLRDGLSYPAAFSEASSDILGQNLTCLSSPNNLLGIEYLRALLRSKNLGLKSQMKPVTVKRTGDGYNEENISSMPSATSVRNAILNGLDGLKGAVPSHTFDILSTNCGKVLPVSEDDFSDMIYLMINTMDKEILLNLPDINPDLLQKIFNFKGKKITVSDLILGLKSKCFTYTAISRAVFKILLEPFYSRAFNMQRNESPYIRLLGFKKTASEYLRNLRKSETCTVITKPSDYDLTDPMYMLDIHAAGIYSQVVANKYGTGFTEELKTGPVMI